MYFAPKIRSEAGSSIRDVRGFEFRSTFLGGGRVSRDRGIALADAARTRQDFLESAHRVIGQTMHPLQLGQQSVVGGESGARACDKKGHDREGQVHRVRASDRLEDARHRRGRGRGEISANEVPASRTPRLASCDREGVTRNAWGLMHPQPPPAPAATLKVAGRLSARGSDWVGDHSSGLRSNSRATPVAESLEN